MNISSVTATLLLLNMLTACCIESFQTDACRRTGSVIRLSTGNIMESKSENPDENLVTDMNIFIFDDRGRLERKLYMEAGGMENSGNGYSVNVDLLDGAVYSIYALANAGYSLDCNTEQEVVGCRYYFAYPDEYRTGIPMSGKKENFTVREGEPIDVPLERTMAKISVSIDRSRLDKDVSFYVNSISIGGCPKSVSPFMESAAMSDFDIFIKGFEKSGSQIAELNSDYGWGKSGEVSLYMFENMQGDLLENAETDSDKVLDDSDPESKVCSYIEICGDYSSDTQYTLPGNELVYRFYLGESRKNFDIRRNTHYHITVTPENSGLSEDSWRVDKSGLTSYLPYYMKISPGTFIRGKEGETFHIRCEYYPKSASFDIGLEELEYDRERGIYDYRIDEDGDGVVITLKKRGSGMLYMETGAPINQAEIINVIVE